jgi:predicted RNA binding protein YcfA (HicA-like mRNA interferase family)
MSNWKSAKAKRVLVALEKIGWQIKRQKGSHKTLSREGWADYVYAFHDGEEIGSKIISRIAKKTGLKPEDL